MFDCVFLSRQGITLQSSSAVSNAKRLGWPLTEVGESLYLIHAPGGYPFYLVDKKQPSNGECQGLFSIVICGTKQKWIDIKHVFATKMDIYQLCCIILQRIDPVQKVCLGVSDLHKSTQYWAALLGMKVMEKNEEKKTALLGFSDTQVSVVCDFVFCFYFT